jgi:hypothetical protein
MVLYPVPGVLLGQNGPVRGDLAAVLNGDGAASEASVTILYFRHIDIALA